MSSATNARALRPRKRLSIGALSAPLMHITQVVSSGTVSSQAQPPVTIPASASTTATTFHSKLRQELRQRRGRLVERLEQAAAEHPGIDQRLARQEQRRRQVAIDAPEPFRLAEEVEAKGMLAIDQ